MLVAFGPRRATWTDVSKALRRYRYPRNFGSNLIHDCDYVTIPTGILDKFACDKQRMCFCIFDIGETLAPFIFVEYAVVSNNLK